MLSKGVGFPVGADFQVTEVPQLMGLAVGSGVGTLVCLLG